MYNLDEIKKTCVNYVIMIFGIIVILIFILLLLYYLSPNNYELIDDSKENKFVNEIEYKIKANSTLIIDTNKNNFLKFPDKTNLIIKNIFKSQNILIEEPYLIKSKFNSNFEILNNTDLEKIIIVKIYSLI
jgi:hypothetical protein